jgi:hypothetical protein
VTMIYGEAETGGAGQRRRQRFWRIMDSWCGAVPADPEYAVFISPDAPGPAPPVEKRTPRPYQLLHLYMSFAAVFSCTVVVLYTSSQLNILRICV